MFSIMFALHLLAVVFTIGPLVHIVTTATRGLRAGDARALSSSARSVSVYSYASVLAVIFGFGLMSATSPYSGEAVASFSETWIWLSALLWLVAVAIALVVTGPALRQASEKVTSGAATGGLAARVSASGGIVAIIMVVIVVLMVYQPGA